MFMLHDVSMCMGKLEMIFTVPCSLFFNVTESLIVLLIIIKFVLYVVIIKIFYFKKD